jgi:phosphate transport system substrate-binding protein
VLDTATQVEGRDATDIALDIDRKTEESGVYPIVLVSYMIGCESYDDAAKADVVKGWLEYVTSEEGQKEAADKAGSAPLSSEFSGKVAEAVGAIKAAS